MKIIESNKIPFDYDIINTIKTLIIKNCKYEIPNTSYQDYIVNKVIFK